MVDALLQPNWREVATKDDLRAQSAELRGEMAELRGELRAEMQAGFASQTRWLVGANTGLAALAITVAKLLL